MIDKLESQNKCAKAKDLGMIPRFASPVMLVKKIRLNLCHLVPTNLSL